jgi:hypothetical protein
VDVIANIPVKRMPRLWEEGVRGNTEKYVGVIKAKTWRRSIHEVLPVASSQMFNDAHARYSITAFLMSFVYHLIVTYHHFPEEIKENKNNKTRNVGIT